MKQRAHFNISVIDCVIGFQSGSNSKLINRKEMLESTISQNYHVGSKSRPEANSPLDKISNFFEMKDISIQEFWLTSRNYASAQDLMSFCSSVGLNMTIHDEISIKAEIFQDREIVSIQEFCESIAFWRQKGKEMVSDFLKKRSEALIEKLQSKEKRRPQSSNMTRSKTTTQFRPYESKFSRQNSLSKTNKDGDALHSQFQTHHAYSTQNNSKKYLSRHREREGLMEKQLAETIDKTKNEYEYGMLLKMSEMNENNREKNIDDTYRAYKSAEGIIRVRIFKLNKFDHEINLKEFERIYKSFKKNTKEKKEWALPTESESKENKAVHSLKMKNARKGDRQQELKNLLVNTVNLTNLLKEQIKIFKKKGIYGSDQL